MSNHNIIGWKECIDFPDWNLQGVIAKSDTGAKGSAIDVKNIKLLKDDKIQFDVVLHRKNRDKSTTIVSSLSGHTRVKSSNGHIQHRYKVKTKIRVGDIQKEIELSLVCRKGMICRVLLGRTALASDFIVDSSEKYLQGDRRQTKIRNPHSIHE